MTLAAAHPAHYCSDHCPHYRLPLRRFLRRGEKTGGGTAMERLPPSSPVGHHALKMPVESRAVVVLAKMAELVDDDVVNPVKRFRQELNIEDDAVIAEAASPAPAHSPHTQRTGGTELPDPRVPAKRGHAGGEDTGCPAAIPVQDGPVECPGVDRPAGVHQEPSPGQYDPPPADPRIENSLERHGPSQHPQAHPVLPRRHNPRRGIAKFPLFAEYPRFFPPEHGDEIGAGRPSGDA